MTLIGIEEHWISRELTRALEGLPAGDRDDSVVLNRMSDNLERLQDLTTLRIAAMDEQGIDLQIISLAPPATQALPGPLALRLAQQANDAAAEAVRAHPTRLRAMATLPLSAPEAAASELERAAGLGLVGAMVYGRTGEVPLDDPRYDDLFATAAALQQPIFIHPQIAPEPVRTASYSGFEPMTDLALATFGWGWHVEAATAALRLIARGTFDRHPDLQVVLGHWGELLLFWLSRAESLSRVAHLERSVSECIRSNFHITSSGMLDGALRRHVLEVTGFDRLLFSTDYPFQRPDADAIQRFLAEIPDDRDRERFTSGNARALFRVHGPVG